MVAILKYRLYDLGRIVAFADRLKDAVNTDAIRDDLATAVHAALEPAHVSVWLAERRSG